MADFLGLSILGQAISELRIAKKFARIGLTYLPNNNAAERYLIGFAPAPITETDAQFQALAGQVLDRIIALAHSQNGISSSKSSVLAFIGVRVKPIPSGV